MKQSDLHVGDLVRFRSWEDMEAQYGLNANGDIACKFTFTTEMLTLCNKECVVQAILDYGVMVDLDEAIWYSISADMLEPVDQSKLDVPEFKDFVSILTGEKR